MGVGKGGLIRAVKRGTGLLGTGDAVTLYPSRASPRVYRANMRHTRGAGAQGSRSAAWAAPLSPRSLARPHAPCWRRGRGRLERALRLTMMSGSDRRRGRARVGIALHSIVCVGSFSYAGVSSGARPQRPAPARRGTPALTPHRTSTTPRCNGSPTHNLHSFILDQASVLCIVLDDIASHAAVGRWLGRCQLR